MGNTASNILKKIFNIGSNFMGKKEEKYIEDSSKNQKSEVKSSEFPQLNQQKLSVKTVEQQTAQIGSVFYEDSMQTDILDFGNISSIPHNEIQMIKQENAIQFCPKQTKYLEMFKVEMQIFELVSQNNSLVQVISKFCIPKNRVYTIKFKIIHTSQRNIYLGLGNQSRITKSHSAKSKDNSIISFHINGKKRFHVLNKSFEPIYAPIIQNGDTVKLEISYEQGLIKWFLNQIYMGETKVDFNNENWYPFVTLKNKGDIIEVL